MESVKLLAPGTGQLAVRDLSVLKSDYYALEIFDVRTINFAEAVSRLILSNRRLNRIPALTALGFWLRRSNISRIVDENAHLFSLPNTRVFPLGKVFHVCPSNVDTIFVYSLFVSLLAGNKNILRISSREQPEFLDFLFEIINQLLSNEKYSVLRDYINLISYPHSEEISTYLSGSSDARIIWGGDRTAGIFKSLKGNPRSRDIVFSDRFSFSLVGANGLLLASVAERKDMIKRFYNDSYTFDQKGCSSPQEIYFLGSEDECVAASTLFYEALDEVASEEYELDDASLTSLKFNQVVHDAIEGIASKIVFQTAVTYAVTKEKELLSHACGGGYFYQRSIRSVKEIRSVISPKIQTISYYGLGKNELEELLKLTYGLGVDRIVPFGSALNFDYVWDGYNLIEALVHRKYFL